MARKRNTLIKFVLAVPVVYFSFVGFLVTITGRGMIPETIDDSSMMAVGGGIHKIKRSAGLNGGHDYLGNNKHNQDSNDNNGAMDNHNIHEEKPKGWEFQPPPKEWQPFGVHGGVDGDQQPVLQQPGDHLNGIGGEHDKMASIFKHREDEESRRHAVAGHGYNKKYVAAPTLNPHGGHRPGGGDEDFKPTNRPHLDPSAPGELGKAVDIKKEELSPIERKKFDKGWQNNAFNQYASDMISLHRTLPDVRDQKCKTAKLIPTRDLPDTSVVIIFHNEAWSVLLRTVHSVLDRSPPSLIKEVILVDDFSDFPHLQQPLQDYVNHNVSKVRLVRGKKREGLIRARLLGASVAQGAVITYLDSHCECAEGWLEPMLSRIAENRSNVVTPVIDVIDDSTLRYQYSSAQATSVGGFDWNLQFNWHAIPEAERKRRKSIIDPVRSPTMAGGLFAIHREYFEYLGTYDPGMDIWGGENLELSFRIWMCGGTLEIIPCSHVGHIFRKRSPYSWKTGTGGVNVVKKNSIRLAEVWMDDYKTYYYERFNNDLGAYGDVSARKALREKLHCKSFDWYIKNVFPDLFVPGEAVASGETVPGDCDFEGSPIVRFPNHVHFGAYIPSYRLHAFIHNTSSPVRLFSKVANKARSFCLDTAVNRPATGPKVNMYPCHKQGGNQIRNKMRPQCLDSPVDSHSMQKAIKMWPCHNQGGNQYWMMSNSGEIRRDEGCMDYAGQFVMIYPCHSMKGNQEWVYGPDNSLRHKNTNLCMELTEDGSKVEMKPCTGVDRQIWKWNRRDPDSKKRRPMPNDT